MDRQDMCIYVGSLVVVKYVIGWTHESVGARSSNIFLGRSCRGGAPLFGSCFPSPRSPVRARHAIELSSCQRVLVTFASKQCDGLGGPLDRL